MKLLFVHDHYFYQDTKGDFYSAGGFPYYLWEKYLKHFDEILVIGRDGGPVIDGDNLVLSSHSKVSFHLVDKISTPSAIKNVFKVKDKIWKLISNVDAVVVRFPSENGLIAFNYAKKENVPCAVEVVGCAFDALWYHGGIISKIYAPILFLRMKAAVKKSCFVLYVSKRFLQKRYPANSLAFTTNASDVDLPNLNSAVLKERAVRYATPFHQKDKLVFGIIGNFKTKYKGLHVLINSLGKLKRRSSLPAFELRILGKGNPEDYMSLIEELDLYSNVIFDGTLPNGEPVLQWIDKIDVYAQPSLTEGLPRSLVEAMSRGAICIGSDVGGIPELLSPEFLFKAGNVDSLSETLRHLIYLSGERLHNIADQNFKIASQFSSDKLSTRRYSFYQNLRESIQ
ncbi:glycosyltransferase family 4 protein [Cyclobacterium roseum]|uniref:glycosyltransferase family 4 protein n=1 Tax=Cyclobacterium roseum TaxID=2666137 RepID=UPI0013918F64|nr:glycosyltransferase family 4 protein [Cyclobacterium roseum]